MKLKACFGIIPVLIAAVRTAGKILFKIKMLSNLCITILHGRYIASYVAS